MTISLILDLIVMSVSLVRQIQTGQTQTGLEQQLLALVQTGIKAYEAETGKPIEPTLLKPIDEVP